MQWRRLGLAAVIAVALVSIVAGFMQAETGDDSVTVVQDPDNPYKAMVTGVHENESAQGAILTISADADVG